MSCADNKQIRCSMCKSMEKSIFYVCKSGRHVICDNCQQLATGNNRKDDGDYIPEKESGHKGKKESSYHVNNLEMKLHDLASGDHIKNVESLKTTKSKKEMKKTKESKSLTTSTPKNMNPKNNSDTTIVYKNTKFSDSKSSVTSNFSSQRDDCKEEPNYERVPRPVACPVTNCSRIVTIDSIPQHFNFDHSKVPRMILNKSGPQHIILNYSTLSTETLCIASFVVSQKRPSHISEKKEELSSIHNFDKGCQLLLLMAAKTTPVKLSNTKCALKVSTRNSYTQTEDNLKQKEKHYKMAVSKSSSENTNWVNKSNSDEDDEEVILLWLCKLDDNNKSYTIMVSGEERKQAYSYIGEAVHIRCDQNPLAIYSQAQCLSVRKKAINKLLTTANELKVIISTVL